MFKPAMKMALALALVGWPLVSARAQNSSNTLVRFHFFHGSTTVGDLVVELFDQDKPVTVQNFLTYVRNGSYDNLILNRCVPNFVLQAGSARSVDPLSRSGFNGYFGTINNGQITNEFDVGPLLTNGFGTLAMAKQEGNPNSASTDWFFNLTNNSATLDTNNGGFTVFGRVVSGTNVLNFFNHPSASLGIADLRPFLGAYGVLFAQLPVAYNPTAGRYPRFSEMYHVQVTPEGGAADSIRPTIKIVSPTNGFRLSNEMMTVTGVATDNVGINTVWYSLNDGEQTNAIGTTNWSADVRLDPGTNHFYVQSVDTSGRRSPLVSRLLFWSVPEPLCLASYGHGTLTGPTNGQILEIYNIYTLSAVPAASHRFLGWTGMLSGEAISWPNPKLVFYMRSNLCWSALFVTNPFPPLKGTYVGTVFNTNFFANSLLSQTLGSMTFSITDQGKITGKVRQGIGNYAFSGICPASGIATMSVPRPGNSPLEIQLVVDVTNRSQKVTGYVTDNVNWTSLVQAERIATGSAASPSSLASRYTVAFPGGTNAMLTPPGDGPASVTVSSAARLTLVGTLADGTPVVHGTALTTNGNWPLYVPLYGGKGALFSWAHFDTNQPNDDVRGLYFWLKHPASSSKLYTNGFIVTNVLAGSVYHAPVGSTNRVLPFTNGIAVFSDGNLQDPLTNQVILGANNIVTNASTNKLKLTMSKVTGLFTGAVTPTNSIRAISFKGAVLQKQGLGTGFFVGTNQAGRVYFGP